MIAKLIWKNYNTLDLNRFSKNLRDVNYLHSGHDLCHSLILSDYTSLLGTHKLNIKTLQRI